VPNTFKPALKILLAQMPRGVVDMLPTAEHIKS